MTQVPKMAPRNQKDKFPVLENMPSDDRDGCLQDAHWYSGYIGGRFQGYAIGNILSAQF